MKPTQLRMESLTDYLTIPNDHRPHQWIRADPPPPALSKLESSLQVNAIGICQLGGHRTD
jgi:hypothetical protein